MEKILMLTPCTRTIDYTSFMCFIQMFGEAKKNDLDIQFTTCCGFPHAIARNSLFKEAYNRIKEEPDIQWIVWMDSDHVFKYEDLANMKKDAETLNIDIVGATYFVRGPTPTICALRIAERDTEGKPFIYKMETTFNLNSMIEMDAIGFGMVFMRPKVIIDMWEKYGQCPFEFPLRVDHLMGEDVIFCEKAKAIGYKIFVNTAVILGHQTHFTLDLKSAQMLNREYNENKK